MTRTSSKLALVTLLAGLLSLASVASVDAGNSSPCTGYAQEHCEQMAADDAIVYHIEAASPMHVLSGNGMGQEHFEAMDNARVALFSVAAPAPMRTLTCTGYAQEHCEAMAAQVANP
jgi:hypothetical protein